MQRNKIMETMLSIYGSPPIDWMNYRITSNNLLTLHHIREKRNGGKDDINNLALITVSSHTKLNKISEVMPSLYEEYNYNFQKINNAQTIPTEETRGVMAGLKNKLEEVFGDIEVPQKRSNMIDKNLLNAMIEVYKTHTTDWMGYPITSKNPLTFHHIIEETNGGKEEWSNGALLTLKAHQLLNRAQIYDPKLYQEYNYWFQFINDSKLPPMKEVRNVMKELKKRLNGANSKRRQK